MFAPGTLPPEKLLLTNKTFENPFKMLFRTSNSAPSARPKPLPIQGMMRRSFSGDGLVPLLPPLRATGRLSQPTLHKIFAGMLVAVFVCYSILMMLMLHRQEKSILDTEGKWGPTMAGSQQVLRDHIQHLTEQRRQEIENELQERMIPSSQISQKAKVIAVEPVAQDTGIVVFEDMEHMDIHDMKPPDLIQQDKIRKVDSTRQQDASSENIPLANIEKKVEVVAQSGA